MFLSVLELLLFVWIPKLLLNVFVCLGVTAECWCVSLSYCWMFCLSAVFVCVCVLKLLLNDFVCLGITAEFLCVSLSYC